MSLVNHLYLKIAGMHKFPKIMANEILDLILKEIDKLKKEDNPYLEYSMYHDIPINLSDLPDNYPIKQMESYAKKYLNGILGVVIKITQFEQKFLGLYLQETNELKINLVVDKDLNFDKDDLIITIEHELIHFTQDLIRLSTKFLNEGKTKIYDNLVNQFNNLLEREGKLETIDEEEYNILLDKFIKSKGMGSILNIGGRPKEFKGKEQEAAISNLQKDLKKRIEQLSKEHQGDKSEYKKRKIRLEEDFDFYKYNLIEEEFFTLLHGIIKEFEVLGQFNMPFFKSFISGFEGSYDAKTFFQTLKKYYPNLWKRAIKETLRVFQDKLV